MLIHEATVLGPGCHSLLLQVMVLSWMADGSSSEEEDDAPDDEGAPDVIVVASDDN